MMTCPLLDRRVDCLEISRKSKKMVLLSKSRQQIINLRNECWRIADNALTPTISPDALGIVNVLEAIFRQICPLLHILRLTE